MTLHNGSTDRHRQYLYAYVAPVFCRQRQLDTYRMTAGLASSSGVAPPVIERWGSTWRIINACDRLERIPRPKSVFVVCRCWLNMVLVGCVCL